MAEQTQEVKARLTIQKEGEAAAFQQVAEDVKAFEASASTAQGPVGSLSEEVSRLSSAAADLGAQGQKAFRDFVEAARDFASTDSLDKQREALERAIDAWKRLAQEVPASIKETTNAAEQLEEVLEGLQKVSTDLADPLAKDFRAAAEAIGQFGKSADEGLSSAKKEGEDARVALDRLKSSIEQVQASGKGLGSAQAAELAKLEAGYNSHVSTLAKSAKSQQNFRKDVQDATEAVGGQVRRVGDLEDLLGSLNPRVDAFVSRWSAAFSAVTVAHGALGILETKLGDLAEALGGSRDHFEGLSDLIPGMSKVTRQWAEAITAAEGPLEQIANRMAGYSSTLEEVTNLQNILRSRGIDPTNLSLQEMREQYARIVENLRNVRTEMEALREGAFGRFIDPKEFELQRGALEGMIQSIQRMGSIGPSAVAPLRAEIQKFVDDALQANREIPPAIEAAARSLGIATTAAERAAQANEKWASSVGLSRKALEEQTATLLANIQALTNSNPDISVPDLSTTLGPQIKALLDSYARLGAEVPPELQKIATAWGVVSSAQERQAKILADVLGASQQSTSALLQQAQDLTAVLSGLSLNGLDTESFDRVQAKIRELFGAFQAAGQQIPAELANIAARFRVFEDGAARAVGNVQRAMQTASGAVSAGASSMGSAVQGAAVKIETSAQSGRQAITNLGEAASSVAVKMEEGRVSIESVGSAAQAAGSASQSAASGIQAAGKAISEAGAAANEGASGLTEGAEQTAAAGDALKGVADSAAAASGGLAPLPEQASSAASALGTLATEINNLGSGDNVASLAKNVSELATAVAAVKTAAPGFAGPILSELDRIIAKAREAKLALDEVVGEAAAGGAA